jgi:hypothetical protein
MTKDDFEAWVNSVREMLTELVSQDFGYEPGLNEVREPSPLHDLLPPELEPLYTAFDGLSFPDVHVGYFIDSAHRIASAAERGEPTLLAGAPPRRVQVFGSDGGGGRFALSIDDGAVYYLPSSGAVKNGVFYEDEEAPAIRIAADVAEFLRLLKADITAFVQGDQDHHYIAH